MTWAQVQVVATVFGWVVSLILVVFVSGRLWQRIRRGEVGDFRLSPLQQIAVDLKELSKTFEREIASLRAQIGTQYTDVVQRVNAHHATLRELTDAQHNEYERLAKWFYTKEMIDRMRAESEKDREALRGDVALVKSQCFDT